MLFLLIESMIKINSYIIRLLWIRNKNVELFDYSFIYAYNL